MKVVLALDKFKGSATARQLTDAVRAALEQVRGLELACVPVADGGDGTVDALAASCRGQWMTASAMGPLLQLPPVTASYFLCDDGTALIEVAAASGLALLRDHQRDVMRTTTLGSGLLMRDALEHGASSIVLGLGGSATCDAAMGIMCALGTEFLDADGHHLYPSGESLEKIAHIETRGIPQTVKDCHFTLLTDVDNPLCGQLGAARVYAPQKGASPQQVELLERGLAHVAALVGNGIADTAGCGAAGGIPALMLHLLDCELVSGARYVLQRGGFLDALAGADLVITGEGKMDAQTLMGKGPGLVIKTAREHGIPVAAVCGMIDDDFDPVAEGLTKAVAVSDGLPPDLAMDTPSTIARVTQAIRQLIDVD